MIEIYVKDCEKCPCYFQDSQYDNGCTLQKATGKEPYDYNWFISCPLKKSSVVLGLS